MPVFAKSTPADLVNGLSTVAVGDAPPANHDDPARTQHLPSGDSLSLFTVLNARYVGGGWDGGDMASSGGFASAKNAPAVITYATDGVGRRHSVGGFAFGYDAAPSGAYLQADDGAGNVFFRIPVTAAGPGQFTFPAHDRLFSPPGSPMVVTLGAGGSGVTGSLTVLNHRAL